MVNKNPDFLTAAIILFSIFLFFGCSQSRGLGNSPGPQQTSFHKLDSMLAVDPRPTLVFLHTDWCRYCQHMKQVSFRDNRVIKYLNEQFYFISFNAEQVDPVRFNEQIYTFQPTGPEQGTHQLARSLGTKEGRLSYPTLVFLDADLRVSYRLDSWLAADDLLKILKEMTLMPNPDNASH